MTSPSVAGMLAALALSGAGQERDEPFTVAFGWGEDGRVPVREALAVGERKFVLTYDLRWTTRGENILVGRANVEFASIDGALPIPGSPELLARQAGNLVTPGLRLDAAGNFLEFVEPQGLAKLPEILRAEGENELAAAVEVVAKSPTMPTALRQKAREAWELVFGLWNGLAIPAGESALELPLYFGLGTRKAAARVELERKPEPERDGKACVRVQMSVHHEGDEFLEQAAATLDELDEGVVLPALDVRSRTLKLDGIFELETARPHQITAKLTVLLNGPDGETRTYGEKRWFAFDWANVRPFREPKKEKGKGKGGKERR